MSHHHLHAQVTTLRVLRAASGQRLDDVAMATKIPSTRLSRLETGVAAATQAELRALMEVYSVPWSVIVGAEPLYVSAIAPIVGG